MKSSGIVCSPTGKFWLKGPIYDFTFEYFPISLYRALCLRDQYSKEMAIEKWKKWNCRRLMGGRVEFRDGVEREQIWSEQQKIVIEALFYHFT